MIFLILRGPANVKNINIYKIFNTLIQTQHTAHRVLAGSGKFICLCARQSGKQSCPRVNHKMGLIYERKPNAKAFINNCTYMRFYISLVFVHVHQLNAPGTDLTTNYKHDLKNHSFQESRVFFLNRKIIYKKSQRESSTD
jgi:hypothetical protein